MTPAFVKLKNDGRLMCVVERIPAGPVGHLLKGWLQGRRYIAVIPERDTEPMPGAPMPGLHLVSEP